VKRAVHPYAQLRSRPSDRVPDPVTADALLLVGALLAAGIAGFCFGAWYVGQ
jgi:hypothetical protein